MKEHLVGNAAELVRNYDLMSILMLCLGGSDGKNYDGVLRMLDVLLSNETSEAEKQAGKRQEKGRAHFRRRNGNSKNTTRPLTVWIAGTE